MPGKTNKEKVRGTWDELSITPGKLTGLVGKGVAKIVGKDPAGRNIYEINSEDLKEIKKRSREAANPGY